ncbi:MAG: DUF4367 domain-containing protein [Oscillospiraceae bacterium]|nr:DUF4367 domain-containing protein [Oscillospiraceae bacterium]
MNFDDFYRENYRKVLNYSYLVLESRDLAEKCTTDVFLLLSEKFKNFRLSTDINAKLWQAAEKEVSRTYKRNRNDIDKSAIELQTISEKQLITSHGETGTELIFNALKEQDREPLQGDAEKGLDILNEIRRRESSYFHCPKWAAGLAAACFVILSVNIVTFSVSHMNAFSYAVELAGGGQEQQKEEIILPTTENDPYGIIAVCEDMDIYIETPRYLPEGFILTDMYTNKNEYSDVAAFTFTNGTRYVALCFTNYHDDNSLSGIGIPSDEHNLTEITVNGHTGIKSMEDNQMVVSFASGTVIYNMFTQDVDYSECDKIIELIR